jgi:LAS superfamily LD-carboxypeptidase LdcB
MDEGGSRKKDRDTIILLALGVLGSLLVIGYQYLELKQSARNYHTLLEGRERDAMAYRYASEQLFLYTDALKENLRESLEEQSGLAERLAEEERVIEGMESEILSALGVVNKLEQLKNTDPELLKKYSRVYFLNEHYIPKGLMQIPPTYVYGEGRDIYAISEMIPFLTRMIDAARTDGIDLTILSSYRSYDSQSTLKSAYTVTYGTTKANKFSADQGYSEHQLGSTVDLTTSKLGESIMGFAKTDAYRWLTDHAHKYGFTLSYPEKNSYYIYEPWHWRFVGIALATRLRTEGKYFYDMDQRVIDEYLITLFDD